MAGNIRRDLQIGKDGEIDVQRVLQERFGLEIDLNDAYRTKHYDLIARKTKGPLTFEVKKDLYAARSGNIAVECYNPKANALSGLARTEATFWVHITTNPTEYWISLSSNLLAYVDRVSPHRIVDFAGDDNATLLLYRKDKICAEAFQNLGELPVDFFKEYLL